MDRTPQWLSPATRRRQVRWASWQWTWRTRAPRVVKRLIDIVGAGAGLLLLLPVFLVLGLLIKLQDGGPVLFWQQRVGRDGVLFPFPKFRSMYVNAEARRAALAVQNQHGESGITFKVRRDPRVTPVGRVIRRCSLDELPQLWSVLVGHMSLVGPRPALPQEVQRYGLEQRARLHVTPGLTCIWQVSGRSELPFETQLRLDLEYIQNPSTTADLKLLAKTVPAVIGGRGAY